MRYLKTFVSVAALLPALAASSQAAKPDNGQAMPQAAPHWRASTIAPGTVIQSAEYLPDGGTVGTTKVSAALLPGHRRRHAHRRFPYRL